METRVQNRNREQTGPCGLGEILAAIIFVCVIVGGASSASATRSVPAPEAMHLPSTLQNSGRSISVPSATHREIRFAGSLNNTTPQTIPGLSGSPVANPPMRIPAGPNIQMMPGYKIINPPIRVPKGPSIQTKMIPGYKIIKLCPWGWYRVHGQCMPPMAVKRRPRKPSPKWWRQAYCPSGTTLKRGRCIQRRAKRPTRPPQMRRRSPRRSFTPPPAPPSRNILHGAVLVSFQLGASEELIDEVARSHRLNRDDDLRIPLITMRVVRFTFHSSRPVTQVQAALQRDPRVLFAQPDFIYRLSDAMSAATPRQYALTKLAIRKAHAIAKGKGVLIAILDTGVDLTHPALRGRIANVFDALGAGTVDEETNAHGTAMASLIAGNGVMTGMAPEARLLAVRAFRRIGEDVKPEGSSMALLKGTVWAIRSGARILNMSFSGPKDTLFKSLLDAASRRGILSIAAAGNQGPRAPPAYPAAYPYVIAVTATDRNDALYVRANRGPYVTIAAPGVGILAARPGNAFKLVTGTSAAAAHVSGIAALLLEQDPELRPNALLSLLTVTAQDLGPVGRDPMFGHGLIDPLSALSEEPGLAKGRTAAK